MRTGELATAIRDLKTLALERGHRLLPQRHVLEALREVPLVRSELGFALSDLGFPRGHRSAADVERGLGGALQVCIHGPLFRLHLDLLRLQGGDADAELAFQGLRLAQLLFQPAALFRVRRRLQPLGQVGDALVELRLVLLQRLFALADGLLQLLHLFAVGLDDDGELVRSAGLVVVAGGERHQEDRREQAFHAASVATTLVRRISHSGTGLDFPFSLTGSRGAASTSSATLS